MRHSYLLIIVLFSFLLMFCSQQKPFIKGTWKLVYAEWVSPDTAMTRNLSNYSNPRMKIFTNSYFAFGSQNVNGSIAAGGGEYTLTGDTLTEHVKYHTVESLVNQSFTYKVWIQNDTLYQKGKIQNYNCLEKYIRVE